MLVFYNSSNKSYLISIIRELIVAISSSHYLRNSLLFKTVLTISEPILGLVEYNLRILEPKNPFIFSTQFSSSFGIEKQPTLYPYNPKFLAKDYITIIGNFDFANN